MISWFRLLERAMSAGEVLVVARDFVASWTPAQLALLPVDCRPGALQGEDELEELQERCVAAYRENRETGERAGALQRMTSFTVRAAVRLTQLRSDPDEDEGFEEPRQRGRFGSS
jgi:hypothetical protein